MKTIHSSWNENRVASCCTKKPREHKVRDPHAGLSVGFVGRDVSVWTKRGRLVFTRKFEADVTWAIISYGAYVDVELATGSTYMLDLDAGEILEAHQVSTSEPMVVPVANSVQLFNTAA